MDIKHTAELPWENGLDVVNAMTPEFRDNLGPSELIEETYAKYEQKTLTIDPETTYRGDLIHLQAGYADLTDAYHDSVEECLYLDGDNHLTGDGDHVGGDYFWRPPGIVHSASTRDGFRALLFLEGKSEGDHSDYASRRIRPSDEVGQCVTEPDWDKAMRGRGWVRVATKDLPWVAGQDWARTQGDTSLLDVEHLEVKVLSHNYATGAQSLLVRLSPGYGQSGPLRMSERIGAFVLEGSVVVGDETLVAESWIQVEAGEDQPGWTSADGATLFCKITGFVDATPA
jgi:hypothetical protein